MRQSNHLLSALFAFSSLLSVSAAPPPNDNFAARTALTGATLSTTGSNVEATRETGEPYHYGSSGGKSVWWTWRAPGSGETTISTDRSNYDTILAVYTGTTLNALTLIGNNDDTLNLGVASQVTFVAVAGQTYQIAVDGFGSPPTPLPAISF